MQVGMEFEVVIVTILNRYQRHALAWKAGLPPRGNFKLRPPS
jgi:hypothetical protein